MSKIDGQTKQLSSAECGSGQLVDPYMVTVIPHPHQSWFMTTRGLKISEINSVILCLLFLLFSEEILSLFHHCSGHHGQIVCFIDHSLLLQWILFSEAVVGYTNSFIEIRRWFCDWQSLWKCEHIYIVFILPMLFPESPFWSPFGK